MTPFSTTLWDLCEFPFTLVQCEPKIQPLSLISWQRLTWIRQWLWFFVTWDFLPLLDCFLGFSSNLEVFWLQCDRFSLYNGCLWPYSQDFKRVVTMTKAVCLAILWGACHAWLSVRSIGHSSLAELSQPHYISLRWWSSPEPLHDFFIPWSLSIIGEVHSDLLADCLCAVQWPSLGLFLVVYVSWLCRGDSRGIASRFLVFPIFRLLV